MVKNAFKHLFRGFFYSIGRFIAFLFLGIVIATLLYKLDLNNISPLFHSLVY